MKKNEEMKKEEKVKTRKRRLSFKEKNFAKEFVVGKDPGNATQAAFDSYNVSSRKMATVLGSKNLDKPRVTQEIDRLLDSHDVTDDSLVEDLKKGLKAKITTNYKGKVKESKVADYSVRHKYFQDAAKMKGWLKETVDIRQLNIDVELEKMSPEVLLHLIGDYKKHLKSQIYEKRNRKTGEGQRSEENPRVVETSVSGNRDSDESGKDKEIAGE